MRILLITDSLGCPREEIAVYDTWTDRILSKCSSGKIHFYTLCKHGLAADDIDINYVKEISPDLIIMQIGIVDACPRALGRKESWWIGRIPIVKSIVKRVCRRYHYVITRLRNKHYCSVKKFSNVIGKIKEGTVATLVFISIAPGGEGLRNKCYNLQRDIDRYNSSVKNRTDVLFLNPYKG